MKCLLLLLLAIVASKAQIPAGQQFQANVLIYNDPNVQGGLTGVMLYNFPGQTIRTDYTVGPTEIIDYANRLEYLYCSGTCDSSTFNEPIPLFWYDSNGDTPSGDSVSDVAGRGTCNGYNKKSPPSTGVKKIYIDNNGLPCRAIFQTTGKTIDFTNIGNLPANAANLFLEYQQWNCPSQQCNKEIDFMLVFDESGSIDGTSFTSIKTFGTNIANAYTFGPQNIAMGLVMFSTTARLVSGLTISQANFLNVISTLRQAGGYTCLTCGISTATAEFTAHGRPGIPKVIIFMTDGKGNRQTSQFGSAVNTAHNSGIIVFAIGVAGYDINEIRFIASNISGIQTVFTTPSYAQLSTILDSLIIATCIDIPGNPCGSGCLGFCSCGATCICPDVCNDNNECTSDTCVAGQNGNGCTFSPKPCNDGDLCTTDTCDPSVAGGCVFTNITCDDHDVCTDDFCIKSAGCQTVAKNCADTDICTTDSCDPTTPNGCVHVNISSADCSICRSISCAQPPCSIAKCDPQSGQCSTTPLPCDDKNACSDDSCNPATGACQYTPVNCDDGDACTHDLCDLLTGCYHVPVNVSAECNDFNLCTNDTCDKTLGCRNINITCADADPCTDNTCNSVLGCQFPVTDCSSILATTVDKNKRDCYVALCSTQQNGCYVDQIPGTKIDQCQVCNGDGKSCVLGLSTGAVIGISAGLLAVIIIASIIVCAALGIFGGKKGYDIWLNHRQNMQAASTNPLYTDKGLAGNNPLYDQK